MKNEAIYFNRIIDTDLEKWRNDDSHKPILLRGARHLYMQPEKLLIHE